jgi:hypothetical protein
MWNEAVERWNIPGIDLTTIDKNLTTFNCEGHLASLNIKGHTVAYKKWKEDSTCER